MDLVHGAKRTIVIMEHVNKQDQPKISKKCSLPLTGQRVVDRIITDRAVIDVTDESLKLVEVAKGSRLKDILTSTEPELIITDQVKYDAF